jgi:hypothetical protein
MPRIDYILSQLGTAKVFRTIDLSSGYHQIPVKKEHQKYTTFVTPHRGAFKFLRTPFGLSHAGDSFMFRQCRGHCAAFVDDVIIYSDDWQSHAKHLNDVLQRLHKVGFTVNPNKLHVGQTQVKLLSHIVSAGKVSPNPEHVRAIKEYTKPRDVKGVQRWLGTCVFFRNYVKDFSRIAAPLFKLVRKHEKFKWEEAQENAFELLKSALTADTCLMLPKMDEEFTIHVDSSLEGIGCCLMQQDTHGLRPVAFASRVLKEPEQSYCITELETLGVVYAVQKFKQYIEHSHVTIETDHAAIKYMLNQEYPSSRIKRWTMRLQGVDCTIKHRSGC